MKRSTIPTRDRITTPAPSPVSPELVAYLAASERVTTALREQQVAIEALRAFELEAQRARRMTMLPPADRVEITLAWIGAA